MTFTEPSSSTSMVITFANLESLARQITYARDIISLTN